ncbi:MAG: hypothetical protein IKK70_01300 [Clostridia bacterium]|nr:hypothetical protein [Clostridia bacterium]
MSRAKHIAMLVFKVIFIILCFALASLTSILTNANTEMFDLMKSKVELDKCEILVMDSSFDEVGASLDYRFEEGKIVFDLVQSGNSYDDVCIAITFPKYDYDPELMRNYLNDTVGKVSEKEEKFLAAMDEGPWNTTFTFLMTGEANADSNKVNYTIMDSDSVEYVDYYRTPDDNLEPETIEDIYVAQDEELTFLLTFGAKNKGALPSGRYVLEGNLGVSGLYESRERLSLGTTIKVVSATCADTLKEKGLSIFGVENWLSFYGVMVVFGMFVYLWRDLRSLKKIFCAMMEERHPPVKVIVKTYVNGFVTDEYSYVDDGSSFIAALIVTFICYVIFLLTIPLRIVIHLIRDIIYLFKEDYELDGFSVTGNILGSVGVYVLLFGIVSLMSANTVAGIIGTLLGIGMCVGAHFLCKRCEEDYG